MHICRVRSGVLVFLPGQQEITEVCAQLTSKFGSSAIQARKEARRRAKSRLSRMQVATPASDDAASAQAAHDDRDRDSDENSDEEDEGSRASDNEDEDEAEQEEELRQIKAEKRKEQASQEESQGNPDEKDEDTGGDVADSDDDEEEDELGPMHILPLYGMLPREQQLRVWQTPPEGTRLVVVATNVAESSITIPGWCQAIAQACRPCHIATVMFCFALCARCRH